MEHLSNDEVPISVNRNGANENRLCTKLWNFFDSPLGQTCLMHVLNLVTGLLFAGIVVFATGSSTIYVLLLSLLFPLCAGLLGYLFSLIHLPPCLGMLIFGFFFSNIPYIGFAAKFGPFLQSWASIYRYATLAILITHAGLSLEIEKKSFNWAKLAFMPCFLEGVVAAIATHFLLDFSWSWSIIMGFVIAGVSQDIVVPRMRELEEKGYGVGKGIPALIIAAESMDNTLIVVTFGLFLSITFCSKSFTMTLLQAPLEIIIGVLYGTVLGFVARFLGNTIKEVPVRLLSTLLLASALFAMFGGLFIGYSGAGPFGCLTASSIAGYGWRKKRLVAHKDVCQSLIIILIVMQPILFGLIGSEVTASTLNNKTIGLGIVVIVISITFRTISTFSSMSHGDFTLKETLFIAVAWIPKATIQAAIGPLALDMATKMDAGTDVLNMGRQIVTIAILAILIMAPIGAIGISVIGPRVLQREIQPEVVSTS